jgi:hypothetical protein
MVTCFSTFETSLLDLFQPARLDDSKQKEIVSKCTAELKEEGRDLSAYNTVQNARDVQAIMQTPGYPEYNIYGVSYDTKLALEVMRSAPEGLRSVVIDSVNEEYPGSPIALAASSLVFGLRHFGNEDGTLQGALFLSVEAGVLLAAAFILTRRLWLGMGLHMSWNFAQGGIFSGAVSGNDMPPGLIAPVISGPELLTGRKFGVEAFTLCTATVLILLVMAIRRGRIIPPLGRRSVWPICLAAPATTARGRKTAVRLRLSRPAGSSTNHR